MNYIRDLIGERAKDIYYAAIANGDNRGMAIVFSGYEEGELQDKLKGLPLIREGLADGKLSLLGRSGRVLLMGVGKHTVRTIIHNIFFENYIDNCMSGFEIITFGYNDGVDICIGADDDFSKVYNTLPNGWMPDMCILPDCEFLLLPKGIENAPFFTVYISYDWDYHVHTTRTFVESVDMTIHDGDISIASLGALGANKIDRFYPHGIRKEFFDPAPRKIRDRKYDILYATSIDDVVWPDRSEWIIKLCELADKYKIHIVPHTTYHAYFELLKDSKIAFSHNRIGEMSLRVMEASSQGAVTVETGHAVRRYFTPDEEYIPVTMEDVEEQVKRYLNDADRLQEISDRVYNKALHEFEPRGLFIKMLEKFYRDLENQKDLKRRFSNLTGSEKHIRRGEIYYFLFFECVNGRGWINNFKGLLQLSIDEFKKAVAMEPTPRGKLDTAIAEAAFCFYFHKGDLNSDRTGRVVAAFDKIIDEHPSYALAYFNLGLAHLRAGNQDEAISIFTEALKILDDPGSIVDPWCLYSTEMEMDTGKIFTLGKALNSNLVLFGRGSEKEAVANIRRLYQAAILCYLSYLYEKRGMLFEALDALIKSHDLHQESGMVVTVIARKLAILGFTEESLVMYRKAVKLLPFNIEFRLEYITLLYLCQMDSEAVTEINNILTMTRKVHNFKDKLPLIHKTIKEFTRYQNTPGYAHDICKETTLNNYIKIIYQSLKKRPCDTRLLLRIIKILEDQGRVDKIFEFAEEYTDHCIKAGNITTEHVSDIADICNKMKQTTDARAYSFNGRLSKLKENFDMLPEIHDKDFQDISAAEPVCGEEGPA